MTRISLEPPRTVLYRIMEWFGRRMFGEVPDPLRATGHHMGVTRMGVIPV
jgi:hypothetical protein